MFRYSRCCDKKYSEEKTLRSHYRDYHPQANYEEVACLICLICCLQFDDIASLQEHAARHAKLECSVCKNLFVNEQSLRSHMLNHSKRERPFTCDVSIYLYLHLNNTYKQTLFHNSDLVVSGYLRAQVPSRQAYAQSARTRASNCV